MYLVHSNPTYREAQTAVRAVLALIVAEQKRLKRGLTGSHEGWAAWKDLSTVHGQLRVWSTILHTLLAVSRGRLPAGRTYDQFYYQLDRYRWMGDSGWGWWYEWSKRVRDLDHSKLVFQWEGIVRVLTRIPDPEAYDAAVRIGGPHAGRRFS